MELNQLVIENGVLRDARNSEGHVIVPDGVTRIVGHVFRGNKKITEISLPDSVADIPYGAFSECENLQRITLPQGLTSIGERAFRDCKNLTDILLPKSLKKIKEQAFSGCTSLERILLPQGLISIDEYTFSDCEGLTKILLPDSVTKIGNSAFSGCKSLTKILLPDGVKDIGWSVFKGCESLTDVLLPKSLKHLSDNVFSGCHSLQRVTMPKGCTIIGSNAFENCKNLTDILLPKSLKEIDSGAFSGCTSLTEVLLPESIGEIGYRAFSGCASLERIGLPDGLVKIGSEAFSQCSILKHIEIPTTVDGIGPRAFLGCNQLLDKQGWLIRDHTVYLYAGSEEVVTVPETVVHINTFGANIRVKQIHLPEGLQTIGSSAFASCESLETIQIPKGVRVIQDKAFASCSKLTKVAFSESLEEIGESAFEACKSLETIQIQKGVRVIKDKAFASCSELREVAFSEGLEEIGSRAFESCKSLRSIDLPNSIKIIEWRAFSYCRSLKTIRLPNGITAQAFKSKYDNSWDRLETIFDWDNISSGYISDNISLEVMPRMVKFAAARIYFGSAEAHSSERRKEYEAFIRKNRKQMLSDALEKGQLSIAGFILDLAGSPMKELRELIDTAVKNQKTEAAALLMAYQQKRYSPKSQERHTDAQFEKSLNLGLPSSEDYNQKWTLKKKANGVFHIEYTDGAVAEVLPDEFRSWLQSGASLHITFYQVLKQSRAPLKDVAYVVLNQGSEAWREKLKELIPGDKAGEVFECLTDIIRNSPSISVKQSQAVIEFLSQFSKSLTTESLTGMYQLLEQKGGNAALKAWENHPGLPAMTATGLLSVHPIEELVRKNFKKSSITGKLLKVVKTGIRYRDSQIVCHPVVLAYIIQTTYEMVPTSKYPGYEGDQLIWNEAFVKNVRAMRKETSVETVMASLDETALSKRLDNLTMKDKLPFTITAFAMICTEQRLKRLWDMNKSNNLLKYVVAGATLREEAFARRYDSTEAYASIHGYQLSHYLETRMKQADLNDEGETLFDLGGSVVAASLRPDFGLDLFDRTNGKAVRSFPIDGNDPEKVRAAETSLNRAKKEITEFFKERKAVLIKDFLNEREGRKPELWQAAYLQNPLMRAFASLLVWQQGSSTFTISGRDLINSSGKPYVFQELPVLVAHPLEMQPEDILGWQHYFIRHKLKQPFEQIWEPVINFNAIEPDRYNGSVLDFSLLMRDEVQGSGRYNNREYLSMLKDNKTLDLPLRGLLSFQIEINLHQNGNLKERLETSVKMGNLKRNFNYKSRENNHSLALLDRWTAAVKVQNDDLTVSKELDRFTLAQITRFIQIATKCNAVKCLPILLEFKQKNFSDFGPMENFTLDDSKDYPKISNRGPGSLLPASDGTPT